MQTITLPRLSVSTLAVPFAAAAGVLALVQAFWSVGVAIGLFLAVVTFLYALNGVANVVRMGPRPAAAYAAAYACLFLLFMVALGGEAHRALMLGLFALFLAGMFHTGAMLGYFVIVLAATTLFPFYRLPLMLLLSLFYALLLRVRRAARQADNSLLTAFFIVSFLFAAIVFFPLLHFVFQRAPQDLAHTLFGDAISPAVREALLRSLLTSTVSTGIALLLGLPLAYVLVRGEFKGRAILDVAMDVPILIPPPIVGIAIIRLVGESTSLGMQVKSIGLAISNLLGGPGSTLGSAFANLHFTGTEAGIIFAQVIVSSPFLIRSAMTAFRGVDARLEYVSRTLGAGPLRSFVQITLPLAGRGIFAGCILAWARGVSEFGACQLVAYRPPTGPTLIYDLYQSHGGAPGPSDNVAIIMTLICLAVFAVLHIAGSRLIWRRS